MRVRLQAHAMANLFLDIETLPAPEELRSTVAEVWERGQRRRGREVSPEAFEEYFLGTSFTGEWGRVFCIGYAFDAGPVEILRGPEREMVEEFWRLVKSDTVFVGHAIFDFDLPFLFKRSVIHRLKPPRPISFARYRSDQIFDVMYEWNKWNPQQKTSLDTLATALSIPSSKTDVHGSEVFGLFREGEFERIYDYCKRDVEVVRRIYQRLTFT